MKAMGVIGENEGSNGEKNNGRIIWGEIIEALSV